jgi:hypothetical protein
MITPEKETRISDPNTGGEKGRKIQRFDLIPADVLWFLAELYGIGATKYADDNWRKGYSWKLSFGAMMRHAWLFWRGESYDAHKQDCPPDCKDHTGCHHLVCAAWHCFTLTWFDVNKRGTDDRPK